MYHSGLEGTLLALEIRVNSVLEFTIRFPSGKKTRLHFFLSKIPTYTRF